MRDRILELAVDGPDEQLRFGATVADRTEKRPQQTLRPLMIRATWPV
jgi:hypothetical protein